MHNRLRGFTLIELLVVIAIIGLLSSIVLASLSTARNKAEDAQRMANVKQVKNALMLYYDDHSKYPAVSGGGAEPLSSLSTALKPYIYKLPDDPSSSHAWRYASCATPCKAYALYVYTVAHGWCRTSYADMLGWWGGQPTCSY